MAPREGLGQWYGGPARCPLPFAPPREPAAECPTPVDRPNRSSTSGAPAFTIPRMQVVAATEPSFVRPGRRAVVRGAAIAVLLLAAGVSLGWFLLTTPVLRDVMIAGPRPTPTQMIAGVVAWALALVVPAGFVLLGVAQAVGTLERAAASRLRPHLNRLARELGDDYLVVTGLRLPEGRRIPELVVGPFGIAVIAEAPTFAGMRRMGGRWEMRDARGRWTAVDSPLDRTIRDGERIRRWLGEHDRDFVVKVHAAVVSADPDIGRAPGCTVVAPGDVVAWLRSLAPQRGLTPARRDHVVELVGQLAGAGPPG